MNKRDGEKDKLIEALNFIDELACITAQDNHEGEANELHYCYDLLFGFISTGKIPDLDKKLYFNN